MNLIDDFSRISPDERKNSAIVNFSTNVLNFGKLKQTSGFLGLGSKKASLPVSIRNTGKSPLILHSVGCDDERIQIVGLNKTTLQPDESATFNVVIQPKTVKGTLDTEIYVICNDIQGPVRAIQVVAER
jgi:hypothetical protein